MHAQAVQVGVQSGAAVRHAGGTAAVTVNQRYNGGRWNALGVFDLAPASGHKVVVDDDGADNTVIADAIRFVRIGDSRRVVADAIKIVPNTAEDALYVHADHLGSPRKMTDATAAVVWNASTTPFGIEHALTGTETNNQRFPGQYHDATSGFAYNYFRHYDPSLGSGLITSSKRLRRGRRLRGSFGPVCHSGLRSVGSP